MLSLCSQARVHARKQASKQKTKPTNQSTKQRIHELKHMHTHRSLSLSLSISPSVPLLFEQTYGIQEHSGNNTLINSDFPRERLRLRTIRSCWFAAISVLLLSLSALPFSLSLPLSLSVSLSVSLSLCPSVPLSSCLSDSLSLCLSVSFFLSALSVSLSLSLSLSLPRNSLLHLCLHTLPPTDPDAYRPGFHKRMRKFHSYMAMNKLPAFRRRWLNLLFWKNCFKRLMRYLLWASLIMRSSA